MKRGLIVKSAAFGAVMLTLALVGAAFAANPIRLIVNGREIKTDVPPQLIGGRTMVPVRWVAEALGAVVEWDEESGSVFINMPQPDLLRRRVSLLEEAVAPDSPQEAVERWAQGVKDRNGALQYAVLSPELKEQKRDYYEDLGWFTGISSPWVGDYRISEGHETAEESRTYEIEYSWEASTGPCGESVETVTVTRHGENWYVSRVLNQEALVAQLQEQARNYLTRKYANHYRISDIKITPLSHKITDSEAEAVFHATVTTIPLYTSPREWPVQKGRMKYLEENRDKLSAEQIQKVEEAIAFWDKELRSYIGRPDEANEFIKVIAGFDGLGMIDEESVRIFSEDGLGNYNPVKEDDPSFLTYDELVKQGYDEMQRLIGG